MKTVSQYLEEAKLKGKEQQAKELDILVGKNFVSSERGDAIYRVIGETYSFGCVVKSINIQFYGVGNPSIIYGINPESRFSDYEATQEQIDEIRTKKFSANLSTKINEPQLSKERSDKLMWQ